MGHSREEDERSLDVIDGWVEEIKAQVTSMETLLESMHIRFVALENSRHSQSAKHFIPKLDLLKPKIIELRKEIKGCFG